MNPWPASAVSRKRPTPTGRIIAKAKHARPDGKPCRGAVSMMRGEPVPPGWEDYGGAGYDWRWRGECPACGRAVVMYGHEVLGTHSPAVKCDARCTGATGHHCECSCGGKNHGRDIG